MLLTLAERMRALEQYVPYGANYDRGVADEYHTASRLIRDGRADEADYFIGLAERCAARHGVSRALAEAIVETLVL